MVHAHRGLAYFNAGHKEFMHTNFTSQDSSDSQAEPNECAGVDDASATPESQAQFPEAGPAPTRKSWRKGRVKLNQIIIVRVQSLQDFAYRSADLAAELGLHKQQTWRIREWCRRGLPHQHNPTGHVLINGREFLNWAESMAKPRVQVALPPDHMSCPGCNAPQPMSNVSIDTVHGRLRRTAQCPHGHTMSQWYSRRRV